MKKLHIAVLLAASLIMTGCGSTGTNPSTPNKVEQAIFSIGTNLSEVLTTNASGETSVTIVPKYTLTTAPATKENVELIGAVLNVAAPGIGGLVSGAILGIIGAWAKMRSAKNAGPVLAQNIETMLEFISTLPDGQKYRDALTQYMITHQLESGVAEAVLKIINTYVSNPQAKGAVVELQAAIRALK